MMCEQCGHEIASQRYDWQGHSFDSRECMSAYQRDQGKSASGTAS